LLKNLRRQACCFTANRQSVVFAFHITHIATAEFDSKRNSECFYTPDFRSFLNLHDACRIAPASSHSLAEDLLQQRRMRIIERLSAGCKPHFREISKVFSALFFQHRGSTEASIYRYKNCSISFIAKMRWADVIECARITAD
jgi:hypothetical protein